ncbi:hypothetical protein D3C81_2206270 [compost metagenome]
MGSQGCTAGASSSPFVASSDSARDGGYLWFSHLALLASAKGLKRPMAKSRKAITASTGLSGRAKPLASAIA